MGLVSDPNARVVEPFEDKAGQWRWRVRSSANGKIVYGSEESYASKGNCNKAIKREFGKRRNYFIREVNKARPNETRITPLWSFHWK